MKTNPKTIVYIAFSIWCVAILFNACKHDAEDPIISDINIDKYSIELRWYKSYTSETKQMAETGLLWAMSFLGAECPKGSLRKAVIWDNNTLIVHFKHFGFHQQGLEALAKLISLFKQSDEYKKAGAIDIGRFIALTLNSSNHYYIITGMAKTYDTFKLGKVFDAKQFVATNSTISSNDRVIDLPDSNNMDYRQSAYIANECEGKIKEGKQRITSFEVKEQMANGQFRFAIYDTTGIILTAAKGAAGKPAKCLWCHESYIQTLFAEQIDEPNYYSAEMFKYIVSRNYKQLVAYRTTLQTDIDYERKQDHAYTELLYVTFMEPSVDRLAQEWGISLNEAKDKLRNIPTHTNNEYPHLGTIYFREDVEQFSPYAGIKHPSSAREKSVYEPDLIR